MPGKWPKRLPPLTPEQRRISDEWQQEWHDKHLGKYNVVESFNHGYPLSRCPDPTGLRTLDIGAGTGGHAERENLSVQEYHAVEIRREMAGRITARFPSVKVLVADCQARLPLPDTSIDRVLAIHVLEHLTNLPAAIREIRRVLIPGGQFIVVIPCEGGLANAIARRISARRIFMKKYKMPYEWWIESEHVNMPGEVIEELEKLFKIEHRRFFPLPFLPSVNLNIAIGLTLR